MTPAAQLQAIVEILEKLEKNPSAADKLVREWGRAHRFAGSHDRKAITARLYAVLRSQGRLSWRTRSNSPRLLVFASLVDEGTNLEELDALCNGAVHHPAPLSIDERAALTSLPDETMPLWARANVPPFLEESLKRALGEDLEREILALNERAPLDLRVNTLKTSRANAIEALVAQGHSASPCPYSPYGLRFVPGAPIDRTPLYENGDIEIQDEGSQLAALIALGGPATQQVVDYCAGAGGKSLAMASAMANRGQIHASDTDKSRLNRLELRKTRAGTRNLQIHPPFSLGLAIPGGADLVLLDVPCSGSGAWRRNPENRWRLTPERFKEHCARQGELLEEGARLVKPGGRLAYVTCSLFREENEDQIGAFLQRHADFKAVPALEAWAAALPDVAPPASLMQTFSESGASGAIRLYPGRDGTDGFFICILKRQAA